MLALLSIADGWKDIKKLNGENNNTPRAKVVSMSFAYRAAA